MLTDTARRAMSPYTSYGSIRVTMKLEVGELAAARPVAVWRRPLQSISGASDGRSTGY